MKMARHCRRPDDDYSDGLNLNSLNDKPLSHKDKVFNVKVNNTGYKTSLTDNDEESNDTGDFSDNCDDFDIKD